ncbi:MAG: YDG domain-containing protein, partial [Thiobacillaceae bacterium]|nr:YDG domain-containing protein [Thiobacillaceae bacterium]
WIRLAQGFVLRMGRNHDGAAQDVPLRRRTGVAEDVITGIGPAETASDSYAFAAACVLIGEAAGRVGSDASAEGECGGARGDLSGLIGGDIVTVSGTFADKHVGSGKTVSFAFGGADVGNYAIGGQSSASASISPKPVIATYTVAHKTYDGTTTATVTGSTSDFISGDAVTLLASGAFTDKHAGNGKTVNITASLSGADASNYILSNASATTQGDILRRPVMVTAHPQYKTLGEPDPALTYDTSCGSAAAPCGLVAGEVLSGALTRQAGESIGLYEILQGTLTHANNPDYDISFAGAHLRIMPSSTLENIANTTRQAITGSTALTALTRLVYQDTQTATIIGGTGPQGQSAAAFCSMEAGQRRERWLCIDVLAGGVNMAQP